MGGKRPPLKHKDAVKGLIALGFNKRKSKATSHEQWIKEGNPRLKVTLDKHLSPYTRTLLASIIKQSGVSKEKFYEKCFPKQKGK